tara:strand:- start:1945 stop:2271 length:327 start_codon:yes stop_codon:yes gene_type:complete
MKLITIGVFMGRKRRLRKNNPKFSNKYSNHPKLIKDDFVLETKTEANIEPPKVEPIEEVKPIVEIKAVVETAPVIEKAKPTRKRRPTTTKRKPTTRRAKAKKTTIKSE